jgi:hypothetical protein
MPEGHQPKAEDVYILKVETEISQAIPVLPSPKSYFLPAAMTIVDW